MQFLPADFHRRSIRLDGYDYARPGAYFVTICTKNRELIFESNPELRKIVDSQWSQVPRRFPHVSLDAYVIMPNHFHGIVIVGATLAVAPLESKRAGARPAPTLGDIVGAFKSQCVRDWQKYIERNSIARSAKFWQRNYYEHIIRNENELNEIRGYILENPLNWRLDPENPECGA